MKKLLVFFLFIFQQSFSQDIGLFNQFNGRYDFTFVGNTLNPTENSFQTLPPTVFTTSDATLTLNSGDVIESAYLYWAGCGTGDFNVKLNGTDITATRTFSNVLDQGIVFNFFSAFADVTSQVQATGTGIYTLSDLDVSTFIDHHAQNSTNFAGWALIVVYKNLALPLNQLNIYDGMQVVSIVQNFLDVPLNALNVIDNVDAKIGFLAWEGDSGLAVNETLRINGNIISNPPLNPANNAFNGTNSVTNSNSLYNMDLDIYNIQNNINVGDTSALIQLTSGQDYVMVNAIVTKLNSQLPDARITFEAPDLSCNVRVLEIDYTVTNMNSTADLPANTPITFYADGVSVGSAFTQNIIPMDGFEDGTITLIIPATIPLQFTLTAQVDDTGNGTGIHNEISEINNSFSLPIRLLASPNFNQPEDVLSCNLGFTRAIFDFSSNENSIKINTTDLVSFYETENDAIAEINQIANTTNYEAVTTPKRIWVRIENTDGCFSIASFLLKSHNCEPIIYNAVSPNNDGLNDVFFIEGLRNIFLNFQLEVYNRWGRLIWTGDNNKPDWNGKAENAVGNEDAPGGTYYYILYLNDPEYPTPMNGYLLLKR
ncbi:gliding motility-associated C-terminal domain-containing protein [Flavobacterium terrigena]|uniref:Gliding motility-associated C-terminal domain-containing protein n=1 Tax=Flavobacterium terrigena TaxID=402734 RepID=A0A1H6QU86_9FLAO|nr:gliding motility-associated C-terminal domain-containing protein [Flavobacterium terrigena]SEI44484.1 gliding motility-associated C-terminal domain-containing protein [Flavobacterium terrigena]